VKFHLSIFLMTCPKDRPCQMSVVAKAAELLTFFSPDRPEIGLSEFRALVGRDKATVYRHLGALESAGLLEQNPVTRAYRIGPAVLRLAHLRELATPRRAGAVAVLPALAEHTGETAHASLLEGLHLRKLAHQESTRHSTRVVMEDEVYPLHATASGAAVLAYGSPALRRGAEAAMDRFTDTTPVTPADLTVIVDNARATGFGVSAGGYETGVHGIAVPLFDQSGAVTGAMSVASVATRITPALEQLIRRELVKAGRAVTQSWGGRIPPDLEAAWARTLAVEPVRDPLTEPAA
jgi:DNA-binding IclR family transcriptional regulator